MTGLILGIDPGVTTGFAMLEWAGTRYRAILGQLKGGGTLLCLAALCTSPVVDSIAIEDFVIGRGSQRAGAAGSWTRQVIAHAEDCARVPVHKRSAATVKPWATDKRLAAISGFTTGLPHAGDALRQAIFSAVKDHGWPDPLTLGTDRADPA